jgi:hypothetical protein
LPAARKPVKAERWQAARHDAALLLGLAVAQGVHLLYNRAK